MCWIYLELSVSKEQTVVLNTSSKESWLGNYEYMYEYQDPFHDLRIFDIWLCWIKRMMLCYYYAKYIWCKYSFSCQMYVTKKVFENVYCLTIETLIVCGLSVDALSHSFGCTQLSSISLPIQDNRCISFPLLRRDMWGYF